MSEGVNYEVFLQEFAAIISKLNFFKKLDGYKVLHEISAWLGHPGEEFLIKAQK